MFLVVAVAVVLVAVVIVVVVVVAVVLAVVVLAAAVVLVVVDEAPESHVQGLVVCVEVHDARHVHCDALEVYLQAGVTHTNSVRVHLSDDEALPSVLV